MLARFACVLATLWLATAVPARAQVEPVEREVGGRDEIRLRWAFAVGALGATALWIDVPVWEIRDGDFADWVRTGESQTFDATTWALLGSAQVGVQTDDIAGVGILRGCVSPDLPLHLSLSAVAEMTLWDTLQLGIGPSIDAMIVKVDGPERTTPELGVTRAVGRQGTSTSGPDRAMQAAGFGPGIEMRISAATGGGPYERRGLVAASFFHLTFLEREVMIMGGLEIGMQSF
ncbi:hypothetical protein [Sandaracinus amylolyticus]|uniref:hypothetical protein n=1 Tax=Sandaracinus amylolyticus TaxID=927083 RepID=UPI001F2B46D0|nr:hypothetical protein [Sandaracinus amylolyticus]UJR85540.1 Hypothetical protein I5071_76200 [Sandaracinus amylolyticus]